MRSIVTSLMEAAGVACIAAGCWMLAPALGLIAVGGGLVAIGMQQAPGGDS
jgi:hypothetical protein